MSEAAAERLLELARLLRRCGDERAAWLDEQAPRVRAGEPGAVAEVRSRIGGGMGSIIDTPLRPLPSSRISAEQANDELWRLVEAFDSAL